MNGKRIQVADLKEQPDGKISVKIDDEAIRDILKANHLSYKKVVVVCTAGPARTGKSFLVNLLLHYADHKEQMLDWMSSDRPINGIAWARSEKPITYGVSIWSKPIMITLKDNQKVYFLVMDTQGLNAEMQCTKVDKLLLTITLQLHDLLMYNVREHVRNSDVCMIAELLGTWSVKMKKEPIFNHLLFLYRDWSNDDDFGHRPNMFKDKVERAKGDKNHSDMYQLIENVFKNVSGFTIPYPGRTIIRGSEGDNISLKARGIDAEFIRSMQELFELIFGFGERNEYISSIQTHAVTGLEFMEKVKTLKWMESEKSVNREEELAQLYLNIKCEDIFNQWNDKCSQILQQDLVAIFKKHKPFVPADKATYEKMFHKVAGEYANTACYRTYADVLKRQMADAEKSYNDMIEKFKDFKTIEEVRDYIDNLERTSLDDENTSKSKVRLKVFASVAGVCFAGALAAGLVALLGPFAVVGTTVLAVGAGVSGAFSVSGIIASIREFVRSKT